MHFRRFVASKYGYLHSSGYFVSSHRVVVSYLNIRLTSCAALRWYLSRVSMRVHKMYLHMYFM